MKLSQKSVYISPNKPSEIIPLLGEALLLYDKVTLDVMLLNTWDVLAANIDTESLEYLLENDILSFVYSEMLPVVSTQEGYQVTSLVGLPENNRAFANIEKMDYVFKAVYPKKLIKQVDNRVIPLEIDWDLLLENSYSDLSNIEYINAIFDYVRSYLNLPSFDVKIVENGCKFIPDKNLKVSDSHRIKSEAGYGLQLLAEVNCRIALLNIFDEVVCEEEFEKFFTKKLRMNFRSYGHKENSQNLMQLCEINDFPDFKELISSRLLTIKDILKLRKNDGQLMRSWLESITSRCTSGKIDFSKEYAKQLSKTNHGLPIPARTIVFGFLQALSTVKPIEGLVLSAAYEFVFPKLVDDWQPRYFFDKARKLHMKKAN